MPRHNLRATAKDVQRSRRDWYSYHYENRQIVKAMSDDQVRNYLLIAETIIQPQMTIFGGVPDNYPERTAYELAAKYQLNPNLINPWYLSDEGWQQFQSLWKSLPEPVDLYTPPCVQLGELYTLYTLPADAMPPNER